MAGYSGKPLIDKLGLRYGQLVYFRNAPKEYFSELGKLPAGIFVAKKLNRPMDFMHFFYTESRELQKDTLLFKQYLVEGGILWVSWPKKASNVKTDISEQTLRDILLPHNLIDIKVVAISDVWSGLKFVWRKS
ncbi:DUF3052 domain-containing protein [Candidatus Saccharibacteria bacterium]|nr:DUF3052 domain-containing protein [Candidatus Saccharibacteria bacterium]